MPTLLPQVFDAFLTRYQELNGDKDKNLWTEFDSQWPSPCLQPKGNGKPSDGDPLVWSPFLLPTANTMDNIAQALGLDIPAEFALFFGRYYSHDLLASNERGGLTLLQVWNEEDFDRLQKNLIAHVLMKRKLKQADTLFFALTDEDDYIISIALSSGQVVLEQVGKEPQEVLANTLSEFIQGLEPVRGKVSL